MKIYLIASLRNREVIKLANYLRKETGHEIFDDWISPGEEADDKWKEYETLRGRNYKQALQGWAAKHVFEFDHYHLNDSDAAILVHPAGKSCHLEFGYTIGQGKPGWIILEDAERWDVMMQFAYLNGGGIAYNKEELSTLIREYKGENEQPSLPFQF